MKKFPFTNAELKASIVVADEGLQGFRTDKSAARAYLGGQRGINAALCAAQNVEAASKFGALRK
jgi:hypothetical protein